MTLKTLLLAVITSLTLFPSSGQTRLITIDGTTIQIQTKGVENRVPGQPVVVFESGLGTPLGNWDTLFDEVAKQAPVVAYDRPGIGDSAPNQEMPTLQNVTERLRKVLQSLKLPPPYLLVGHSLGGVYVRGFALYYPQELAGLVIIDPADFTETCANLGLPWREVGFSQAKVDTLVMERKQGKYKPNQEAPIAIQREGEVLFDLRKAEFTQIRSTPLPDIPVAIVTSGRFDPFPNVATYDEALFKAKMKYRIERWTNLMNTIPRGRLFYSANAGHFVHRDDPLLVIASIQITLRDYEKHRLAEKP
jgi:pimeloyl-ACP methyl ester carboxylesterase